MAEIRARSYLLTGNNPEKLIEEIEIDHETATEEDYRNVLQALVDRWVKGDERHADRSAEINGVVAVCERGDGSGGEGGTFHVHVWLSCKNPVNIKVVKSRFPRFHIDVVKAKDVSEVEAYLYKSGVHEGKKHTQLCEPLKWGGYFCVNSGGKGSKIYDDLAEHVENGLTPSQIILADPRFAMHEGMVQAYYGAYVQKQISPIRTIKTVYRTGEVAAGKSFTYVRLCEEHGEENVYLFNGATTTHGGWDEYEAQKYLVLDEVRSGTFRLSELLSLLQGYKMRLPARYKNKYAAWEEVHITTVIPPEDLFRGMKRDGAADAFAQLQRRIDTCVYHFKDARYEGADAYRTVSVAGADYVGIEQLRLMAEQAKRETR